MPEYEIGDTVKIIKTATSETELPPEILLPMILEVENKYLNQIGKIIDVIPTIKRKWYEVQFEDKNTNFYVGKCLELIQNDNQN